MRYYARASNDDDWKPLTELAAFANNPLIRLGHVIPGEKSAHMVFNHEGHTALFKVDLADQRDPELVFWHEQRDRGALNQAPRSDVDVDSLFRNGSWAA